MIVNNSDFITKILDNILTNTNLSDIINQIEPLQKENESLRSLLNSQQTTLNELSGLVMKLLANGLPSYVSGAGLDGNHDNPNIFVSGDGEYTEQDVTDSNYVFEQVDGGTLEEVVERMEVVDEEHQGDEEDEEDKEDKEDKEDRDGTEA